MEVGFPAAKAREDDNASLLGAAALCSDASEEGPPAAPPAAGATPADPYHLTYWAFVLQGVGMLFPWNVFITAAAYYRLKFKGLPQEDTFEVVFGFVYTISNLLALVLIMAYGGSSFSALTGVILPNAFTAFLFAISGFLVFADTLDGSVLYAITLFSVFCCGVFAACLQAGIFGLSSRLPAKYVQATVSGQAISGAAVSLLSLISLSTAPCDAREPTLEEIQPQSFAYFFSSTVVVCATLLAFVWLVRRSPVVLASFGSESLRAPVLSSSATFGVAKKKHLVQKIWRHCLGVCVTFTVTLALFPGLTVRIASAHNPGDETCRGLFSFGVWTSFLFLIFNLGDTLGRQLTLWKHVIAPERAWWLAFGRLIFIPLMLGCNLRSPLGGPRDGDASTTRFTNMTTNSTGSAGVVSDGAGAD